MHAEAGQTADFDVAARTSLRLGIAYGQNMWLNIPGDLMRVRATDLRHLARQVAAVRSEHPGCDVLADINVAIAGDARSARSALEKRTDLPADNTLLYVGTPVGLAGLVADLYALHITDGAVLIPLLGRETLELIRNEVVPELQTFLPVPRTR
ncbi:hypothetical protein [Mycobacterium sp.]|uniref:hypothetical protein n=1 Tax=Mycobacterium sp. TaxID=1785 RepID=UPI0011F9EA3F|nr:hypothetical protein [Mycobacterium sp.]TAM72275.1 MAG: hypothetical protein EPN51_04465 [Mycobacterium sp.]